MKPFTKRVIKGAACAQKGRQASRQAGAQVRAGEPKGEHKHARGC